MAVQLADPSINVSFPMNKSDNNNSVLIPKEVTKQAQTGSYVVIFKLCTQKVALICVLVLAIVHIIKSFVR